MQLNLTDKETRIIGCLIEKSVTTPDQYPLTLNALTNACNQKSSRNPVMSLRQGEVQHVVRGLEEKSLVRMDENFKSRTEKYVQRFCNTRFSDYQFNPAQLAIVCLLLLRGPQTPGELRAHSGRLHTFVDNADVVDSLNTLINWESGPLVMKLPRLPGRKDAEYAHLFSGTIDVKAHVAEKRKIDSDRSQKRADVAELEERVSNLEAEVAALKERLTNL